jgi:hypothetical protein
MGNPQRKQQIIGQGRSLKDNEAAEIQELILQAQNSDRQLSIPLEDLSADATITMNADVARVINESKVTVLLGFFNRDFLYGQGRFDEYSQGLILKWGDGYSRKHIWVTAAGDQLSFEVSHEKPCGKAFCVGGHHIYSPEQWRDIDLMNEEMAEQFRRPVYERSDD